MNLPYLWYCLDKLARIEDPLLVFGHSLGTSDQHIANVIVENPKLRLIAVGLHGAPDSPSNRTISASALKMRAQREELKKRKRASPLDVLFYDSDSAHVWG